MPQCCTLIQPRLPRLRPLCVEQTTRNCVPRLARLRFSTSSVTKIRQRLTLRSRQLPTAGVTSAKLRLTGKKSPYRYGIRERIQLGVQWQGVGVYKSLRKIRGVSRVRYIRKDGSILHNIGRTLGTPRSAFLGKQPVRTKYVWLGDWARQCDTENGSDLRLPLQPRSFSFDSNWTTRYHLMVEKGESVNLYLSLQYPNVEGLIRRYAGLGMSIRSTHLAWMHIPPEHRLRVWEDVMLWCLHNNAVRALKLLLASMKGHQFRPARHVVGDCLQYLAKTFLHKVTNPDPWALNSIYHLVHKYVKGGREGRRVQHIPDQVVFLMLKHCDDKKVLELLNTLASENVQLHANTLLHALKRALDMGNVNFSLRLLRLVSKSGIGTHRDQVQSACVRLIRAQFDTPESYTIQTKILTQILEMGIRPKIALYNAILLNTVEAGYYDLASKMFNIAKENDLAPDGITSRILLRGATDHADRASRRKLIRDMESNLGPLNDSSMITELLHAISKSYQPAFPRMLEFYKQHCDLRPLEELGICERKGPRDSDVPTTDQWPSPTILGQMLCAYVHHHRDSKTLIDTYTRYHDLVVQIHPLINPVSHTDHVANTFILAFGRDPNTLPHCTTVIKHMLDDSSSKRLSVQPVESYPKSAAPTVQTWSILAAAYFKHKQKMAAERVLELMRERGLEPDQVTWNAIISGYSSLQQLGKAVDAVRRMEAAGYRTNSRTLKALDKIWNRDRLLDALERNLGQGKVEAEMAFRDAEDERASERDDIEEMANGWETDNEVLPGLEIRKYLRERYQNLAAEQRRREGPDPEAT